VARLAFLLALSTLISLLMTPIVRAIANYFGIVDHPGERRINVRPTPRLGGVAVYLTMLVVIIGVALGRTELASVLVGGDPWLMTLGLSATLVMLVGVVDDVRSLSPLTKLAGEFIAALIVVASGYGVDSHIPGIASPWLGQAIAIFWIVAVTNAFNLIDGLDGLAAGLGVIICGTLFFISIYSFSFQSATMLIILGGALLGFLRYNFYPSTIFLGDSGSLLLGFLLAVFSVSVSSRLSAIVAILVPVLALGVPLVETAVTAARRLLRSVRIVDGGGNDGRYGFDVARPKLFAADREHIHHRLLDLGWSHRGAVLLLYIASLTFGGGAFLLVALRTPYHAMFVAAFGLAAFVGIRRLNYGEINLLRNGTLLPIFELPLVNRRLLHVLIDLAAISISYFLSVLIVNDFVLDARSRFQFVLIGPPVFLAQLIALWTSGLYLGTYRYTGIGDLLVIGRAVAMSIVAGWIAAFAASQGVAPKISLTLLDGYLLATLVGGSRVAFTILDFIFKREQSSGNRALLYGADRTTLLALREIETNRQLAMRPIGFVDDTAGHHLRHVQGYPVHSRAQLLRMIEGRQFDVLVIVSSRMTPDEALALTEFCESMEISVRRFSMDWQEVHARQDVTADAAISLALDEPEAANSLN